MTNSALSMTEHVVLAVLSEGPTHGFAISKELDVENEVGKVFTVARALVYRALDRLVESGYAEPVATEQRGGPKRVVHEATGAGHREHRSWLALPVSHIRDLRIDFLLKLTFLRRAHLSPVDLIRAQREALRPAFDALNEPAVDPRDHVEQWRRSNARAAAAYLDELESAHLSSE